MSRLARLAPVLGLAALAACSGDPAGPRDPGPLSAAIAPGDITVIELPTPGIALTAIAASADGSVFGRGQGPLPQPLYAWSSPYTAPPVLVDPDGMVNGGDSNAGGDAMGWKTNGPDGVWVHTGPSAWTFVGMPMTGFADASPGDINDVREMTLTVALPGLTGVDAWRAAYMSAPGATPLLLPNPPGSTNGWGIALNNPGDAAGYSNMPVTVGTGKKQTTSQISRAVLWRRTGPSAWAPEWLPTPGASATTPSSARAINDAGQIVGHIGSATVRWTPSGSSWTVETVTSTSTGGAPRIDACGRVGGSGTFGGLDRGYVWDGSLTILPVPAGVLSAGVNDIGFDSGGHGVLAGATVTGSKGHQTSHPVLWTIPGCP